MATIASLNVDIGATGVDGTVKGIHSVGNALSGLGKDAALASAALGGSIAGSMDNAAAAAQRASRSMDGTASSFANAARNYRAIGASIQDVGENLTKFVTLPITLLAGASIKAYGDLQALEKGFNAVYKGAQPAGEELAKLSEVAKLPGLGLKEAIQGSIRLQAVGFSAEQSRKTLAAFGNAISTVGGGKADLDGVTLALTQIASKGKISAEEINQLAERVPQVRKAMQSVFGTADTEQLQKMGIGAEEFVAKITQELAKLPTVTGGINNAFENMADAGFVALSKIGEALNNSFNVEAIFGRISDALTGAAEAFGQLNPAAQGTIFLFAGLAAAIGPLLIGAGALVSAWGVLGLSFAAITGPIGIAALAIGAAAVLIIANWDKVVSYFESSGLSNVFAELGNSIGGAVTGILDHISNLATLAAPLWDSFLSIFSSSLVAGLKITVTTLTTAFDIMGKTLALFSDVFSGNWTNLWTSVGNLISSIWNGIVNTIFTASSSIIKIVGGFTKAFGLETIGAGFDRAAVSIENVGRGLISAYNESAKVAGSAAAVGAGYFNAGQQTAFAAAQAKLYGSNTTGAVAEATGALDAFVRTPHEKKVKVTIEKVPAVGALTSNLAAGLEGLKFPKFEAAGMDINQMLGFDAQDSRLTVFDQLNQAALESSMLFQSAFAAMGAAVAAPIKTMQEKFLDLRVSIKENLTDFFVNNLVPAVSQVGDAFSNLFAGGEGDTGKKFFASIIQTFAKFAGDYGKLLLAYGAASIAAGLVPKGIAQIAAGAALLAAAGFAGGAAARMSGSGGSSGGSGRVTPYNSPGASAAFNGPGIGATQEVRFILEGTQLSGLLRNTQYKSER